MLRVEVVVARQQHCVLAVVVFAGGEHEFVIPSLFLNLFPRSDNNVVVDRDRVARYLAQAVGRWLGRCSFLASFRASTQHSPVQHNIDSRQSNSGSSFTGGIHTQAALLLAVTVNHR